MHIDPSGQWWLEALVACAIVAAVAVLVVVAAPVVIPALTTTLATTTGITFSAAAVTTTVSTVVATATVVADAALITAGAVTIAGVAETTITYFAEHRKVKKTKWDKHTKPRAGRKTTKNRDPEKGWKDQSGKRRFFIPKLERDESRWF